MVSLEAVVAPEEVRAVEPVDFKGSTAAEDAPKETGDGRGEAAEKEKDDAIDGGATWGVEGGSTETDLGESGAERGGGGPESDLSCWADSLDDLPPRANADEPDPQGSDDVGAGGTTAGEGGAETTGEEVVLERAVPKEKAGALVVEGFGMDENGLLETAAKGLAGAGAGEDVFPAEAAVDPEPKPPKDGVVVD